MKLKYYFQLNWLKTLYVNFRTLPLRSAIKLPVLIFPRTRIKSLRGRVIIDGKIVHGMIKIGRCDVVSLTGADTVLSITGTLHLAGKAVIGRGSSLVVQKNATLQLGENFRITGGTTILCEKSITVGNSFLSSWDNLIMDSDHHDIVDISGRVINPPCPVTIGNHVWLGCRTTLLKGCTLPDNCIVAAGSVLTRNFTQSNSVIGGCGREQTILRQDINWKE